MEFSQLRPGVWLTVVEPESVTVGLVAGTEASLLIDAGTSPAQGRELRAAAARVTDKPLRHVVVTHGHWDHVCGLPAFADVETIGHESLAAPRDRVPTDVGRVLAEPAGAAPRDLGGISPGPAAALPGPSVGAAGAEQSAPLPLPLTTTLADIGFRDLGGVAVEIAHFGPAHTQSDLIIALPGPQVVFAGDLIETSGPPQFDDSTSIEGWVKTIDALYALLKPNMLVVPGHGPVVDGGEVGRQRAGLTMLWGQAEWAFLQSLPEACVYSHEGMAWLWDEATTRQGIALAYRELRAKPEPALDRTGPTFG